MSDLYNRIYALCQGKGITIGRMCKELGISRGNLTELKMERIKTLKPENLTKISGYFGVTVDYLLGTETEKAPTLVYESGRNVNIVTIAGRDGSYMEKRLTDEQVKALQTIIDQMPEAPDDL